MCLISFGTFRGQGKWGWFIAHTRQSWDICLRSKSSATSVDFYIDRLSAHFVLADFRLFNSNPFYVYLLKTIL